MYPAVEAKLVSRRFGARWALIDVSLEVAAGEALLLTGPNGSGKSTLLGILAGALRPDTGEVRLLGQLDRGQLRRHSALLAHRSFTYEPLSGLENLRAAARFLGKPAHRADLLPLLDRVGLAERADDPVHTFSAGMRKRLALARVVLQDPALVLLDEPYSGLDSQGADLLEEIVNEMRSRGAAILVASHLTERTGAWCDRALVLRDGQSVWTGPTKRLPQASSLLAARLLDERSEEAL